MAQREPDKSRLALSVHMGPNRRLIIHRLAPRHVGEGCSRGSVMGMGGRGFRIESNQVLMDLARNQAGLVSREQLNEHGAGPSIVKAQVAADRWCAIGSVVVATFTGPLLNDAKRWAALLNAGPGSALCGRSALEVRGLTGWSSDTVQVIVNRGATPERLDGVRIHESLVRQGRIRRRRLIADTINDLAGGAQALSEIDYGRLFERWGLPRPTRQAIRLDQRGRRRYLDVEWTLPGGAKKALEIDGIGHIEPNRWYADLLRAADITATDETPILRLPAAAARVDEKLVVGILRRYLCLDQRVA